MEYVKEKHVTLFFGIPVTEKYITGFDSQPEKTISPRHSYRSKETEDDDSASTRRKALLQLTAAFAIIMIFLSVLLYYPPAVVDNLVNVVMRSCPEKMQLDAVRTDLKYCEKKKVSLTGDLQGCSVDKAKLGNDITKYMNEKTELEKRHQEARNRVTEVEKNLKNAEDKVATLEKTSEELQANVVHLKQERDKMTKKFDETELALGACKNKNMDHEIANADLIQEVEDLRKEVAKC